MSTFDTADNFDLAFGEALKERQLNEAEGLALDQEEAFNGMLPHPSMLPAIQDDTDDGATPDKESLDEEDDGPGFLGTIADISEQLVGGVRDAGVNVAQTVFDMGGLLDSGVDFDELIPDVDEAETGAGAFARGTAQFLTGFIPALGAMKALRATKAVSAMLNRARGSGAVGTALTGEIAKFTGAGAIADFAVFDPHEQRLSNLAEEFGFNNPLTGYLAADPDDGEFEGRLKSVLEGAALGLLFDGIIRGLRFSKKAAKGQRTMVKDDLLLDTTRQEYHAASQDVTLRRTALSEAKQARDAWHKLGKKGGDQVADEAQEALAKGSTPASDEAANLIATAEYKAGASGRTIKEELDELTLPMDARAKAASPLGRIEEENPDLAFKITETTSQGDALEEAVRTARNEMDDAEERFYDIVTTDDWRANYDDVRIPMEKNVDDFVPDNIKEEYAETQTFLNKKNCDL